MPIDTTVSAAIGITEYIAEDSIDTFVARATQALNQAKNNEANSVAALEAGTEPVGEPG
jgi:PleD family two-component response regulator